jgi:CubicO group peptidase (beta-lactamase class C family)
VDKQVPSYNNINFTIFRDLLPFLEGARDQGPAANRFFIAYVQRQVFGPVGVTDATCAPVREAMLMYPPPFSGTAPGSTAAVGPSACAGGGWFMTPASMLRVLQGLISGRLLSGGQRQLMDANCLGWDSSIAGQTGYRGKYGGCCGGPAGLQIFFGILAGSIPVVIATNSNGPPPLQAVVQTALRAATSPR